MSQDEHWEKLYNRSGAKVYPTEWVVRTLAGGNYPQLKLDKSEFQRKKILDLGCGDGRNIQLLLDLGFDVSAIEISDEVLQSAKNRHYGEVTFKVGKNHSIPFASSSFDYILSSASFYYLDENVLIDDVLKEISRTLKPGGTFIANICDMNNSVVVGAEKNEDGSYTLKNDPFHIRNGSRFQIAESRDHLTSMLGGRFKDIITGTFDENYYGLRVSGYMFLCVNIA